MRPGGRIVGGRRAAGVAAVADLSLGHRRETVRHVVARLLRGQVVAENQSRGKILARLVLHRAAGDEVIDPAGELEVEHAPDLRRVGGAEVVAIAARRVQRESRRGPAGGRLREVVGAERRVPLHGDILARHHGQVAAHARLRALVQREDAGLVCGRAGDEVLHVVTPAIETQDVLVLVAGAKPGIEVEIIHRAVRVDLLVGHDERIALEPACRSELRRLAHRLVRLERPAGATGLATLGKDLDHTGRRFGAVQRRRGGALDHLDAVDVRGIDVVERAVRGVVAVARVARGKGVLGEAVALDAHAVHVDERLVALGSRHVAAQADGRAAAHAAAVAGNREASRLALEQIVHAGWNFGERGDVDLRDRVAHLATARRAGRAGDDDLVEAERLALQRDRELRGLVVRDGHRARIALESDHAHLNGIRPGRNVGEGEGADIVALPTARAELHLRVGDGGTSALGDDSAAEDAGRHGRPRRARTITGARFARMPGERCPLERWQRVEGCWRESQEGKRHQEAGRWQHVGSHGRKEKLGRGRGGRRNWRTGWGRGRFESFRQLFPLLDAINK